MTSLCFFPRRSISGFISNDLGTDNTTLFDQSWHNPLDVSKGHRGYIDGDFIMILYAWSPNWCLNVKGNDRYELCIRRYLMTVKPGQLCRHR